MLNEKELNALRENAKVHKEIFREIEKMARPWVEITLFDKLVWDICKKYWVIAWFKGYHGFPANICISINDCVAHWIPRKWVFLWEWDMVNFDLWVRDKKYLVNTDAGFTMLIWDWPHKPLHEKFLKVNKEALAIWVALAIPWNKTWDIWAAIQKHVESNWFKIVRDLTGHWVGKNLHEKPYIYNYWTAWTWELIKAWMTLAIEPIIWLTEWKIFDKWDWDLFMKNWSFSSQFEHTILVTNWKAEIIV